MGKNPNSGHSHPEKSGLAWLLPRGSAKASGRRRFPRAGGDSRGGSTRWRAGGLVRAAATARNPRAASCGWATARRRAAAAAAPSGGGPKRRRPQAAAGWLPRCASAAAQHSGGAAPAARGDGSGGLAERERLHNHGLKEADKVSELPGQPGRAVFDQYAGYVTVNATSGKALFYYFAEAAEDPSTKPLVLWLNGGPGCSSLGGGAMLEIGPFFVNSDNKTLSANKYAWNNVANMLFLESPAGVGFSYSNTTSDYNNTGDSSTAADAYTFLINWLERFPAYKGRSFFIAGESYGGHYIPQLANTILSNNKITNTAIVNLKGVAIGNAYLDDDTNTRATIDYYWTHAMISKQTHQAVQKNCSFNGTYTGVCKTAIAAAKSELGTINQYNIYASFCWNASNPQELHGSVTNTDPCAPYYIQSYLNRPEVQRALHANTTGLKQPWSDCSDIITPGNWKDAPVSMLPSIQQLISSEVSTWLYSGDIDAVCPVTSTLYSLDILGLLTNSSWRSWYSDDNEVGGYVVGYEGLVFATVRGAGHMVATFQPQRALTLFSSFLQGKLPPE